MICLQEKFPGVDISDVIDLVAHELKSFRRELDGSLLSMPELQHSFRSLTSWDWMWGETPLFELDNLKIHKGIVKGAVEMRFEANNLKGIYSQEMMTRLFPDFSRQYKSQLEVF